MGELQKYLTNESIDKVGEKEWKDQLSYTSCLSYT